MFPATSQSMPAERSRCPVSAVTVLLPLVPVIATTCGGLAARAAQANSSMSPTTGMLLAMAAWTTSSCSEQARG